MADHSTAVSDEPRAADASAPDAVAPATPVAPAVLANPTLGELFAAWVARTPHAPALTDGSRTWTYQEVAARVEVLAGHLTRCGAGPERTVALVLPRSMELIVAELAVARAGAAFLPVDPAYPAERRAMMLADAAPAVTLDDLADLRTLIEGAAPFDVDGAGRGAAPGRCLPF